MEKAGAGEPNAPVVGAAVPKADEATGAPPPNPNVEGALGADVVVPKRPPPLVAEVAGAPNKPVDGAAVAGEALDAGGFPKRLPTNGAVG